MKLLTNLLFEPKGMHNSALAYKIKDTVMSADGSRVYFALQDVPSGIALTNENYWKLQIDLSDSKSAMDQALASFSDYAKIIGTRVKGETAKATGNPVTFLPDAGSLLQPVTVLEPKQAGSGDPSPSNIRLITGYDKLELNAAGKNLVEKIVYGYIAGGSTEPNFNVDNESVSAIVRVVKGQQYKISCAVPLNRLTVAKAETTEFAAHQKLTNAKDFPISGMQFVAEFTGIAVVYIKSTKDETVKDSLQIELGSTASPFVPYAGNTYTVQIGQTVYGGKFDWLTGKMVAEYGLITLDGTEGGWRRSETGRFSSYNALKNLPSEDVRCSHYRTVKNSEYIDQTIIAYKGDTVYFTDNRFADAAGFAAYIAAQKAAGTPVQIACELATPVEIQLTPHIISAVEPEQNNALYGDGNIEVEYVKPLHVSIEERVAAAMAAAMNTEGE